MLKRLKQFLAGLLILSLNFLSVANAFPVFAQEITPEVTPEPTAVPTIEVTVAPTPEVTPEPTAIPTEVITPTPEPTAVPTEIVTPTVEVTPTEVPVTVAPEPTPIPVWQSSDAGYVTTSPVAEGQTYIFPDNASVKVTFTKVAQPGFLRIKQVEALGSAAYDITSDMSDGTFIYNLTLPNPAPSQPATVKYSEDGQQFTEVSAQVSNATVEIANLDHFTIFVVINPNPAGNGNQSDDVCVTGGGSAVTCYDTIQAAVDAAATGDTINIKNGFYAENVTIATDGLQLIGESQSGVIIDNSGSGTGISITANNITLQTLTIQNFDSGAGIEVISGGNISQGLIDQVTVSGNGDGISLSSVTGFTIQNSTIDNNTFTISGVYMTDSTGVTISGNTISNHDTGIDFLGSSSATIAGNIFTGNSVDIVNDTSNDITATGNDWGTTDSATIAGRITDVADSLNTGRVLYDQSDPTIANAKIFNPNLSGNPEVSANSNYQSSVTGKTVVGQTVNVQGDWTDNYTLTNISAYVPSVGFASDSDFTPFPTNNATWNPVAQGTYSVAWNTVSGTLAVADGDYDFTLDGKDYGNSQLQNSATPVALAVTVDNSAPNVTFGSNAPADTATVNGAIDIEGDYSDTNGLAETSCGYDSTAVATNTFPADGISSCNLDTTTIADGSHTIYVTGVDKAGNSLTQTRTITVDNTAPIVTMNALTTTDTTPQLTGTVDDPTAVVQLTVDSNPYTATNNGDGTWTLADDTITPALADNTYSVAITGTDTIGNVGNATGTLIVDTTAPTVSISSSSHTLSTWNNDRSIDISWIGSDTTSGVAGYSYVWDTNTSTTPDTTSDTTGTSATSPNQSTGQSIYFHIRAVDNAGNWGATTDYGPFWVDASNPTGTWVNPLAGDHLRGIVDLEATASDVGSGVQRVTFRIRPTSGTYTNIAIDTTSPYQATLDTTTKTDGTYDLRALVRDNSTRTNASTNAVISVTIDNTAPIISSPTLTNDTTSNSAYVKNGDSVTLTATITDTNQTSITTSMITADLSSLGGGSAVNPSSYDTSTGLATWSSLTVSGTADSTVTVTIDATDKAGNSATQASVSTLADNTAPSVDAGVDKVTNALFTQDATASDSGSGIASYAWTQTSGSGILTFGTAAAEDTSVSADTDDNYTVKLTVTDTAGNSANDSFALTWDTTAPTGSWTTPTDGSTISGSVTLATSSSDNLSGVSSVVLKYAPNGSTNFATIISPWDTTPLTLGQYTLRMIITDNAGNSTTVDQTVYVAAVITSVAHYTIDTNRIYVSWTTDRPTDGRIVYGTSSVTNVDTSATPNYQYLNSTGTADAAPNYTTTHSLVIGGLSAGTNYFFRLVSGGTPIIISQEYQNRTYSEASAGGGGGGGGGGGTPATSPVTNVVAAAPARAAVQGGQVAGAATEAEAEEEITPTLEPTPEPSATPEPTPEIKGASTVQFNWWLLIIPASLLALLMGGLLLFGKSSS